MSCARSAKPSAPFSSTSLRMDPFSSSLKDRMKQAKLPGPSERTHPSAQPTWAPQCSSFPLLITTKPSTWPIRTSPEFFKNSSGFSILLLVHRWNSDHPSPHGRRGPTNQLRPLTERYQDTAFVLATTTFTSTRAESMDGHLHSPPLPRRPDERARRHGQHVVCQVLQDSRQLEALCQLQSRLLLLCRVPTSRLAGTQAVLRGFDQEVKLRRRIFTFF